MGVARLGAFTAPDLPDPDALASCVHCGICLPQCPTYCLLGQEMDSPRGRLYLMRAAAEGRVGLTERFARHLDLCLGCRACETACPSGVPFGSLLEAARSQVARHRGAGRFLARALFGLFPHPGRLGALLGLVRLYQGSGLGRLVRASGVLRAFPRLAAMEALLPEVPAPDPLPEMIPAVGPSRGRAGLLTGCVQRHLCPAVNRATARLLALAGYDVLVPATQGCCGALELHAGRLETFRERARRLVAAFPDDCAVIVTDAAGCGSAMKEYRHWLADPDVERFAARTRDVSEVLHDADLPLGPLPLTVAYHDACHLAHGQRIRHEPRELLSRIPGLRLTDLAQSDVCCGSAGIYNLLEPAVADRLLAAKIESIAASGAAVVATGNPGCLLQIARGVRARGLTVEVRHPVELLLRSVEQHPEGRRVP